MVWGERCANFLASIYRNKQLKQKNIKMSAISVPVVIWKPYKNVLNCLCAIKKQLLKTKEWNGILSKLTGKTTFTKIHQDN